MITKNDKNISSYLWIPLILCIGIVTYCWGYLQALAIRSEKDNWVLEYQDLLGTCLTLLITTPAVFFAWKSFTIARDSPKLVTAEAERRTSLNAQNATNFLLRGLSQHIVGNKDIFESFVAAKTDEIRRNLIGQILYVDGISLAGNILLDQNFLANLSDEESTKYLSVSNALRIHLLTVDRMQETYASKNNLVIAMNYYVSSLWQLSGALEITLKGGPSEKTASATHNVMEVLLNHFRGELGLEEIIKAPQENGSSGGI